MRNAFAAELLELADNDERIVFLSGDIGNRLFDSFKEHFPERFYNCGVAEQNMIGMAAGLAMCGLRPICYTIASFATVRCLEQIRVDVCYHNVPVIIVGVGAGLGYAELGATHHACEDIAMMRSLPGMSVVCPGDPLEVRAALAAAVKHDGPVYLRLGKKGEPVVHESRPNIVIGGSIVVRKGCNIALLVTGTLLPTALEVARLLAFPLIDLDTTVVSCHTVKPLDEAMLTKVFGGHELVVTIEEHSRAGGYGSAVAEWLIDRPPVRDRPQARLMRIGTDDRFLHLAADEATARAEYGLDVNAIVLRITDEWQRRS